jgi:hypothetical protein
MRGRISRQIADNEARHAAMSPGSAGEPLWQSDLYSMPTVATVADRSTRPGRGTRPHRRLGRVGDEFSTRRSSNLVSPW